MSIEGKACYCEKLNGGHDPHDCDKVTKLRRALSALLAWESYMGGFEAPAWGNARRVMDETE